MKKVLLGFALSVACFLGLTTVKADMIDLDTLDTNTYIIGERVYELNEYYISIYDVVEASAEYSRNHDGEVAPIYYLGAYEDEDGEIVRYLDEVTGPLDQSTGILPTEEVEIEEVYPGNELKVTTINNQPAYDFVAEEINPAIEKAVEKLNENKNSGFESITFDGKVVTFNIIDSTRLLEDYQDSGIVALFKSIVSQGKSVTYKANGKTVTKSLVNITEDQIIAYAFELLSILAGEDAEVLDYESVANKEVTAKVTFENDGLVQTADYTIKFVGDVDKIKDAFLNTKVEELNKVEDDGFLSIEYDAEENVATFNIENPEYMLEDYRNSGIVGYFKTLFANAVKATYTIDGVESDEINLVNVTEDRLIALAFEVLSALSNEAEVLNYGSVAGRTVTATIVYNFNGKEVPVNYTVTFKADVDSVKDAFLTSKVEKLNEVEDDGFLSIEYDAKENVATFNIENPEYMLEDYKNSGIVGYFKTLFRDAVSATYTIDEVESDEISLVNVTEDRLIALAFEVLSALSNEAEVLNYGSVAGRTVTATIVYNFNGQNVPVDYTVTFN